MAISESERYFNTEVGRAIRLLREHRQMSRRQLGEQAGLSPRALGNIEAGRTTIYADVFLRIAQRLRVVPEALTPLPYNNTAVH